MGCLLLASVVVDVGLYGLYLLQGNSESDGRSILYLSLTQALVSIDLMSRSNASMIEKRVHGLET